MAIVGAFMVPHPPIILPEVGRGEEEKISLTKKSYEVVADRIAELKPETIIITSPHSVMYADYFHISPGEGTTGNMAQFRASEVSFVEDYDKELVDKISSLCMMDDFPAGSDGEKSPLLDHGTMVPLYFIRQKYEDFKLVRIGLSGLSLPMHYEFGQIIQKAVNDLGRKVVFVGSGDLSHKMKEDGPYGFAKEGPEYDERIMEVCRNADFEKLLDFDETFCERAAECGHRSFTIMAGALDGMTITAKELSHEATFGVGYGICTFEVGDKDDSRHFLEKWRAEKMALLKEKQRGEDPYVELARYSLESYIVSGKRLKLSDIEGKRWEKLPKEIFKEKAGAFVSIHKDGALRGCIDTILPTRECVAEEILQNAISAAVNDPRFPAITEDELPFLEMSVDVLGTPEPIKSKDELDVKKYGVIVTSGRKRGLLLPNLDGVDTIDYQIEIACRKAGIYDDEEYSLERFEVVRHE